MKGELETRILTTLKNKFSPMALEVRNTSYDHASHEEVRGRGSVETHFSIEIKSKVFNKMVSCNL